tara:strand:+ start:509 stop:796 length:288 start_codon:yes stop_codon:yes gene_type:complete
VEFIIRGSYGEAWHLESGCECDGTDYPSPVIEIRCEWDDFHDGYVLHPTCTHGNEPPFTGINDWFDFPKTLPKLSEFYNEFGDSVKKIIEVKKDE